MLKNLFYIIVILVGIQPIVGQENNFSQFYSSPQYLNPAFAGDVDYIKIGGAARLMQPLPGNKIINSLIHFDYKSNSKGGGIGFTFFNHTEQLAHSKFQFNYSYSISFSEKAWVKAGLGVSVNQRRSGAKDLYYPDQYTNLGLSGQATAEPSISENSIFPGVAAGIVVYSKKHWLSLSGDYINLPTENFAGQKSTYPLKLSFMAGMLIPLNREVSKRYSRTEGFTSYSSLGPMLSFVKQDKYIEVAGGATLNIKSAFGGLYYRYQHDYIVPDNSYAYKAIVLMTGYRREKLSLTYSYDFSLSQYTVNKAGAHELSLIFYLSSSKPNRLKTHIVPLPNQLLY